MRFFRCHFSFQGGGGNPVDGSEILMKPVDMDWYAPIIYKVLYIPGGYIARCLSHQQ